LNRAYSAWTSRETASGETLVYIPLSRSAIWSMICCSLNSITRSGCTPSTRRSTRVQANGSSRPCRVVRGTRAELLQVTAEPTCRHSSTSAAADGTATKQTQVLSVQVTITGRARNDGAGAPTRVFLGLRSWTAKGYRVLTRCHGSRFRCGLRRCRLPRLHFIHEAVCGLAVCGRR